MNSITDIIGKSCQNLLQLCDKHHIAFNLDIENPSLKIFQEKKLRDFITEEASNAVKSAIHHKDGHVAIIQKSIPGTNMAKISVKYSGDCPTDAEKAALKEKGYEVRSRFGYDTVISIKL